MPRKCDDRFEKIPVNINMEFSAAGFHKAFDDRQTEPMALCRPVDISPGKPLRDRFLIKIHLIGRCIFYNCRHCPVIAKGIDKNTAAFEGIFQGIFNKILINTV